MGKEKGKINEALLKQEKDEKRMKQSSELV